jgi:hypothetical protein
VKSIAWIGVFLLCSVLGAQTPAQQPASTTTQAPPTQPAPVPQAPPPPSLPTLTTPEENIENMTSIALFNWQPNGGPSLIGGRDSTNADAQTLELPTRPSQANGLMLTLRAKGPTRLEFSYFDVRDNGNLVAGRALGLFGATIPQGDPLILDYRLRVAKITWNYLTYPVPATDAKFRLKTLWEVQYVVIRPDISFPLLDNLPTTAQRKIIYPTFGLGAEYVASKHFRMEARFSGFGLPHKATIWDGEGSLVGRFGPIEIFGGAKAYHFKTSPNTDIYAEGTLWGPYGGLRWVFR